MRNVTSELQQVLDGATFSTIYGAYIPLDDFDLLIRTESQGATGLFTVYLHIGNFRRNCLWDLDDYSFFITSSVNNMVYRTSINSAGIGVFQDVQNGDYVLSVLPLKYGKIQSSGREGEHGAPVRYLENSGKPAKHQEKEEVCLSASLPNISTLAASSYKETIAESRATKIATEFGDLCVQIDGDEERYLRIWSVDRRMENARIEPIIIFNEIRKKESVVLRPNKDRNHFEGMIQLMGISGGNVDFLLNKKSGITATNQLNQAVRDNIERNKLLETLLEVEVNAGSTVFDEELVSIVARSLTDDDHNVVIAALDCLTAFGEEIKVHRVLTNDVLKLIFAYLLNYYIRDLMERNEAIRKIDKEIGQARAELKIEEILAESDPAIIQLLKTDRVLGRHEDVIDRQFAAAKTFTAHQRVGVQEDAVSANAKDVLIRTRLMNAIGALSPLLEYFDLMKDITYLVGEIRNLYNSKDK